MSNVLIVDQDIFSVFFFIIIIIKTFNLGQNEVGNQILEIFDTGS